MEKRNIYAIESKEDFKETIEICGREGCLLYDGVRYTLSYNNDGVNLCMAEVDRLKETEMVADSVDKLLENYLMHDGKKFGDVLILMEYD